MNDMVGGKDLVRDGHVPLGDDIEKPTAGCGLVLFDRHGTVSFVA
jgi:hypothetical protein